MLVDPGLKSVRELRFVRFFQPSFQVSTSCFDGLFVQFKTSPTLFFGFSVTDKLQLKMEFVCNLP